MSPLAWMNPARWLLYLALAGTLALGLVLWIAGVRNRADAQGYARATAEHTAAALAASEAARKKEQDLQAQVNKAVDDAKKREKKLAADAAAARSERDGLRAQLDAASRELPGAACHAVREYAATVNELFSQCAGRLEEVARAADGHASDARALMDAWPR